MENGGDALGGSSSGGSSSDGGSKSGSAAESTGGSAHGGQPNGGSGGRAAQCDGFEDEIGGNVAVRLINGTKMPLYLGQETSGCGIALFHVSDANGQPLSSLQPCTTTCQNTIDGNIASCPPTLCPVGLTILLQPGESVIQQWTANFVATVSLPPECSPGGNTDCQRIEAVKPGSFTFSSRAGTNIDCSNLGSMGCGPCTVDSSGGCVTYGALVAGPFLSAEAHVELDASYGIGGPGQGAARAVEITFKN